MHKSGFGALCVALLASTISGCDSAPADKPDGKVVADSSPTPLSPKAPAAPTSVPTWSGDLPGMIERRVVRMLVVHSKTFYFIYKGQQRGITYDFGMELEKHL